MHRSSQGGGFAFIGERLQMAREARGLSLTSLGDMAGLSKQMVSKYEKGAAAPRQDNLTKIGDALRLPPEYFFRPLPEGHTPPSFRSVSSVSKRERLLATSKLYWLSDLLFFLEDYLEFPEVNIPNFGFGRNVTFISMEEIDTLAEKCREHFGLSLLPIPSLVNVIENNGCVVITSPLGSEGLDAFSTWIGGYPVIVLDSDKNAFRDRFTIAHELGHLVLHKGCEAPTREDLKIREAQANRFASAFLLPEKTYTRDFAYPKLDVFLALKKKWKASIQAQVRRCYDLQIITQEQYGYFNINISRRGWKKEEPLDAEAPAEIPRLLRNSIELLNKENIIGKSDLADAISVSMGDLASITGIELNFFSPEKSTDVIQLQTKKARENTCTSRRGNIIKFPR